jgi:3-phosphoshikimate 1-carboxyvinyltransferase
MFSLLSDKPSTIRNFLKAEDTLNSLNIAKSLGATVEEISENEIKITPPQKLKEPSDILDCGNAGTGIRLYCGLLSAIDGYFVLTGDKYLRHRPMKRVIEPLSSIGAKIYGRDNNSLAPLTILGSSNLDSFDYESQISSAQVKSAMILAGIHSKEKSYYKEPSLSRDHTERMLNGMGANIENSDDRIVINPITKPLEPLNITVPSDPSSGFFFAIAAAITPNSYVKISNVTLNPTRVEAYKILSQMGADVEFIEKENIYEPIGDIIIKHKELKAVTVDSNIAWLIDELPALAIAMSLAKGKSIVKNAKELRVKESDRISSVVDNLKLCGIECKEYEDGYEIDGGEIQSATINSYGDHRVAMSFAIAGIVADMNIIDTDCIETSFPNFVDILSKITKVNSEN